MKDYEHLLRVAGVFAIALVGFFGIRAFLIPKSFGQYGHYRAEAINEIAALPTVHAGHQFCEVCHVDIHEAKTKGKHTGVACEACHGPQGKHADDPGSVVPQKPDPAKLCAQCHESSASKPASFPQISTADHFAGTVCNSCHPPHDPLNFGGAK